MQIYFFLFLLMVSVFSSCKGQSSSVSPAMDPLKNPGDTVSELSKNICRVYQSENGDYWFGSDTDGAYKFDGKVLLHYTAKDGIGSNRIRGIQEDKKGNIYLSTLDGIVKFNGRTFTKLIALKSKSSNENWKLQPDDLWFSMPGKDGDNGPYRYDGKNLYQLEFPKHHMADAYFAENPDKAWSPYEVYYIYKDNKGIMWFGTSNFGICRYDGKSFSWLYEAHLTLVPGGGSFGIRSILEDSKGKFWFCNTKFRYKISPDILVDNDKSLIKYEREKGIEGVRSPDGLDFDYFISIAEDDIGNLWLATYADGVWKYDGKNVKHYQIKNIDENVKLFTIYKDLKGTLWLGSHESGAFRFNGEQFEMFKL